MTKLSRLLCASLSMFVGIGNLTAQQPAPADAYHCGESASCSTYLEARSALQALDAADTSGHKFVAVKGKKKKETTRYTILNDSDKYIEASVRKHGGTDKDLEVVWRYLTHVARAMSAEELAQNSPDWKRWKKDTLFSEENVVVTFLSTASDPAAMNTLCNRLNVYTKRFNDAEEDSRIIEDKGTEFSLNPEDVWQAILKASYQLPPAAPNAETAAATLQAKYCLFAAECQSAQYAPDSEKHVAGVDPAPAKK
ncbi:MAG: hypothetical protein M3Y50_05515 [Acidobacteriota bacterium]|nr:hypothetical protein [Acidobacteriota bacterium]